MMPSYYGTVSQVSALVYSLVQSSTAGGGTDLYYEHDTTYRDAATKFTASSSYNLGKVEVDIRKYNNANGNHTCIIYADNAGSPGTLLGTSDIVLDSTISTSFGYVSFTFSTLVPITDGTAYWIALGTTDTYSVDHSFYWRYAAGGTVRYWNGSSWATSGAFTGNYKIYSAT